jgi:hypothetical protein
MTPNSVNPISAPTAKAISRAVIMGRPSKQAPEPPVAGLSPPGGVGLVAWCQ